MTIDVAPPVAGASAGADDPAVTVIHCPRLFDAESGTLQGPSTIVVEGARICEVVVGSQTPASARVIDLPEGSTALPGLIDAHTHLTMQIGRSWYSEKVRLNPSDYAVRSTVYARRTLLAGFTAVRNVGDLNGESLALRNAVNAGYVAGPRIFSAGQYIGTTGGHADPTDGFCWALQCQLGPRGGIIDSPADAWLAVRQHYKDGADLIKIMTSGGVLDESASSENSQMTLAEVQAIVAAAHDYGFTVAVHAHGAEGIRRAIAGGVDSIEHGTYMDDADIALMKQHGTWLVPTIIAGEWVKQKADEGWYPPQVARKAREVGAQIMATAGKVYRAGVRIAFGTDAGVYPHGQNAQEFVYMVQAGMPPVAALQAATIGGATLLRHADELGQIKAGQYANVIAVAGNPLDDVAAMKHVEFVMKEGVVYKEAGQPTDACMRSSL